MNSDDELTGNGAEEPRKKGGGDGSAKSATGEPAGETDAADTPGDEEESGGRSRQITTPNG